MKAPMHKIPRPPDFRGRRWVWACVILTWCLLPALAHAQGSIFGTVQNANLTNPPATDLYWVGFLDDTDEEIRIELNTGAGYDGTNWYDDFQNYTTRVAGNPYDYFFVNVTNGQGFHLAKTIPANSFQQENILLAPMTFPARPAGLVARVASVSRINLSWNYQTGVTYHVYRRATANNGTFRRLDSPTGLLTNPGVTDSFFVDVTSDGLSDYTYIIIGQNPAGNFSAHSLTVSALASAPVAPTVATVTPDSGSAAGGIVVTIKGTNFDVAGVSVTFGANPATGVTVQSPFALTCTVPSSGFVGAVNVVVTNSASGLASAPLVNGFRYLGNLAPVLDLIGSKSVAEGATLSFRMHATDPDLTIPVLSAIGVPLHATFVDSLNGAGSLVFNPDYTQAGVFNVTFIASDGSLADTEIVAITVTNTNLPPVLDAIGAKSVAEGANLAFRTHATDPDGAIPTLTAVGVPLNATFVDSLNGSGSFVFDPSYTQSGVFNVTFIASDGSLADTEVVAITVTNTNRPPVLDLIGAKSVAEGANLTFRTHATDPDGAVPTLTAVGVPLNATFVDSLNGSGSFVFNPSYTQSGIYSVTFIASDGLLADSEVVAITVANVNLPPVLDAIGAKSVAEGASLSFRTHATDPDGTIPVLSAVGVPLNATFVDSLNGAGSLVFNPNYTQLGVYSVTFIASDGSLADTEVVAITVTNTNLPPVLDAIGAKSVAEGANLTFRTHATDPDGAIPALTAVGVPVNATFVDSLNGSGSFVFNPNYSQTGVFNVTFIASDGSLADTEVVAITVTNTNLPPVLDAIGTKSVAEGANLTFRTHATDPDGAIPTLTAVGVPMNAIFVDSLNGSGSFVFNPSYTQSGVFDMTFIASDGSLADTEIVAITVTNTNRPPVLDLIGAKSVVEGANLTFRTHATDPDGAIPTLTAVGVPVNATFVDSLNGSGSFVFNPSYTQSGVFNVTFIASDGSLTDTEIVAITVTNTNLPPVLDAIGAKSVVEGANLTFRTHATDPDGAIPTLTAVGVPVNATFVDSLNGAGSFAFNPDYSQTGIFNVTFIASDGSLADTEVVAITVTNTNRPPVLDAIGAKSVAEGANLTFRTHATDPDGAMPTLTAVGVPLNATFVDSLNGAGSFVFNPDYSQTGVHTVTFIASDGSLADTEIVAITVTNTNLPPVLDAIGAKSVAEGANLTFRTHATDPDGTIPALTAVGVPLNATFVDSLNGSGSFVFNPDYSQTGIFNVTFITSDGSLADTEIVAITVTNTNQAPILDPIGAQSVTEATTLTFRTHAIDPDGPIPLLTAINVPLNATFVDSGNGAGSFVFNPGFTQAGIHNVTFIASDGLLADSEVVTITVIDSGNQRPVLDLIGAQTVAEAGSLSFRTYATDPDATIPILSAVGLPANAAFVDSLNGAGGFVFNPDYTQAGLYNIIFIASDGVLADSEIVPITVTNTNRPPVLDPIGPQSVAEGASLAFRTSSSDPDGTVPVLSAADLPANATFADSANGAGSLVFNPDYTQSGVHSVTFIASDGSVADTEIVTFTVTNTNRPPVLATIGPKVVNEGSSLLIHVTATDPDLTVPALAALNLPLNATFTDSLNGRGGFVFNPDFVQSGAYQVTFIASDGVFADTEIVMITVNDQGNLPPVFDPVPPDTLFEGDTLLVRIHAVDPEGGPVILGLSQALLNGAFVDSGNGFGLLTFMPNFFQAGVDTARILAIDNGTPLASNLLKLAITIKEKNLPPVLSPIGSRTVLAGDSLKIRVVAKDTTAAPGGLLFMAALNLPANATFQDSGGGVGKFRFLPTFGQIGSYNVTFVATDNGTPALAALEAVTITVQTSNRAPALAYIGPKTVNEGDSLRFNVYATDIDGTIPFLRADSIPKNAVFVDSGNGVGTFTFRPNYIQAGLYNVKFTASDGLASVSQQVFIQVYEVGNQAPILGPIGPLSVLEKSMLTVLISATDPDFTIPTLKLDTLIENASFVDSGNGVGVFRITPQYWQDSVYTLTFTTSDGTLADTEVVTLTIFDIGNQLPFFLPFTQPTMQETQVLYFTVAATDSDGVVPSLLARPLPAWAAFVDSTNGKGSFTFAPGYTDSGTYSMYVVANDMDTPGASDSALVTLHVTDKNRPPTIDATSFGSGSAIVNLVPGETQTVWVHGTDPDLDAQPPRIGVKSGLIANMVFADSGNGYGYLTFTPSLAQVGSKSVSLVAVDRAYPADSSGESYIVFNVGQRNVAPILDPIGPRSTVEAITLQFLVTASDSNATTPIIEAFGMPANASLVSIAVGQSRFTFLPSYTQAGVYSVLFRARDGQGLVDSERVAITVVEAGNQKPHWASPFPTDTVKQSVYGTYSLHVWATDVDNATLTLSVPNLPPNAAFVDSANKAGLFNFVPTPAQADSVYNVRFVASDGLLADTGRVIFKMIAFVRGDLNMDKVIDVFDAIYLLDYIFSGGPDPLPVAESGNVNGDINGIIDVFDLTYLLDYIFSGGPPPPP